jgi:hypothetical protein
MEESLENTVERKRNHHLRSLENKEKYQYASPPSVIPKKAIEIKRSKNTSEQFITSKIKIILT